MRPTQRLALMGLAAAGFVLLACGGGPDWKPRTEGHYRGVVVPHPSKLVSWEPAQGPGDSSLARWRLEEGDGDDLLRWWQTALGDKRFLLQWQRDGKAYYENRSGEGMPVHRQGWQAGHLRDPLRRVAEAEVTCPPRSTVLLDGAEGDEPGTFLLHLPPRHYLCADCGVVFVCRCEEDWQRAYMDLIDPDWTELPTPAGPVRVLPDHLRAATSTTSLCVSGSGALGCQPSPTGHRTAAGPQIRPACASFPASTPRARGILPPTTR